MNKKALLDAELYAKTGRIRTSSPPTVSDDDLEIVDLLSDSDRGVQKSHKSGSLGICRCEEETGGTIQVVLEEKTKESLREPHLVVCVGKEAEDEKRTLEVEVKAEPSSSPTEDSVQETDSKFVPSDSELDLESNCTSTSSEDVNTEDTEKLEDEASEDIEEVADQVRS